MCLMELLNLHPIIRNLTNPENSYRVVSHLYTVRDPRRKGERPLASDILLSFWNPFLQIPIEHLRTIFLDTVREDSMKEVRPDVYGLRRKSLRERLSIERRGDRVGEKDAFNLTYAATKFGRCVRTMEKENIAMIAAKMKVSRFTYAPHNAPSSEFDVTIDFTMPSVQRPNEGDRRGRRT